MCSHAVVRHDVRHDGHNCALVSSAKCKLFWLGRTLGERVSLVTLLAIIVRRIALAGFPICIGSTVRKLP